VAFSAIWSGLILLLSSEAGVEWQGRKQADVPTVAMGTGIVAAGIVGAAIGVHGGKRTKDDGGEEEGTQLLGDREEGGLGEAERGAGRIELMHRTKR